MSADLNKELKGLNLYGLVAWWGWGGGREGIVPCEWQAGASCRRASGHCLIRGALCLRASSCHYCKGRFTPECKAATNCTRGTSPSSTSGHRLCKASFACMHMPTRCSRGPVPKRPRLSSGPKPQGWGPLLYAIQALQQLPSSTLNRKEKERKKMKEKCNSLTICTSLCPAPKEREKLLISFIYAFIWATQRAGG